MPKPAAPKQPRRPDIDWELSRSVAVLDVYCDTLQSVIEEAYDRAIADMNHKLDRILDKLGD